jgi:50S ribosomal protein L16 3-hydroxylase
MNLTKLLGKLSVNDFLNEYFFKLPLAISGSAAQYRHLGDWEKMDSLLRSPAIDLLIAGQRLGVFRGNNPTTRTAAYELLQQGYTLGFRHVQDNDDGLFQVAKAFERDFAAPVDIHLYCTPAGVPGFGWHYDAEEVFVVQTYGSKEWSLRKNTVNPWPIIETLPEDMAYHREIMPLMRCKLEAGDWLYIPAGYWHSTTTTEDSISLSIGINCQTGLNIYDAIRSELLQDMRWRQRLPITGQAVDLTDEEKQDLYRHHFRELAEDLIWRLQRDDLVQRFLRQTNRIGRREPGSS